MECYTVCSVDPARDIAVTCYMSDSRSMYSCALACSRYQTNFSTPVRPLEFFSSRPYTTDDLVIYLRGGTLSFVGDSVTAQAYQAMCLRAGNEGYRTTADVPVAQQAGGPAVDYLTARAVLTGPQGRLQVR